LSGSSGSGGCHIQYQDLKNISKLQVGNVYRTSKKKCVQRAFLDEEWIPPINLETWQLYILFNNFAHSTLQQCNHHFSHLHCKPCMLLGNCLTAATATIYMQCVTYWMDNTRQSSLGFEFSLAFIEQWSIIQYSIMSSLTQQ